MDIEYAFNVVVPALTVCPVGFVDLSFDVGPLPAFAQGTLSNFHSFFFIDQEANLLNAVTYGPLSTHAAIVVDRAASSGAMFSVPVIARATPSSGITDGCTLTASEPVEVLVDVEVL